MIIDSKNTSLEEKVYLQLEDEILTGKLKRGTQLRETALAERLEASRTPIRGALHRLAEDGLVDISANKGATVVGITEEDIRDIYEIRMRLEGLAARLAAERMSNENIEELKNTLELSEFYAQRGNDARSAELDSAFHSIIFGTAGSRHLCKILSDLHKNIRVYRKVLLAKDKRAEKSLAEHKDILRAIENRDADEAERLAVLHIVQTMNDYELIKA